MFEDLRFCIPVKIKSIHQGKQCGCPKNQYLESIRVYKHGKTQHVHICIAVLCFAENIETVRFHTTTDPKTLSPRWSEPAILHLTFQLWFSPGNQDAYL